MSKRVTLSDREVRIIGVTLEAAIKSDEYHIKSSLIVGKLGEEVGFFKSWALESKDVKLATTKDNES